MAVKVNGNNVILYKVDTSTFPATESPFACSTSCSFYSETELTEISSASNAYFKEPKVDLSKWTMSCNGIITLDNFSYDEMLQYQKDRLYLLVRFEIDNGIDGKRYISGYCFIGSISINGNYKEIGTYNVNLVGTGKYYTEKTPTTTTSTTSTSTSTTSTTSTSTTSTTSTTTTTTAAPTTTTTTSTTTTTTTLPLVYYRLLNCATQTSTTYTIPYVLGTFNINDRVIRDSDSATCVIDAITYSTPSGTLYSVTATAGTGCPATTTTTTTAAPTTTTTTTLPLVFYRLFDCSTGTSLTYTTQYVLGTFNLNDRVITVIGSRTCVIDQIEYSPPAGPFYDVTPTAGTGCPATTTTTTTAAPTTTTTTTLPLVYYRLYNCQTGTSLTWTIPYVLGTFNINDRVITDIGSIVSVIDAISYSTPSGTLLSVTATAGTGCPATTTTTTTTTSTTTSTTTTTTASPYNLLFTAYASGTPSDACNTVNGSYANVYGSVAGGSSGDYSGFVAGHTYYNVNGTLLNTGGGYVTGAYWADFQGFNWTITSGFATVNGLC
jgi:hypothetical protein